MTSILSSTEAIYCKIFRCIYLRNEKYFVNFFLHFLNLESILNILKKKMSLIADVFLNLQTPKYVVREMSKKPCFRRPLDKWHGKRAETLLKSERQHLYHIYWSLWRILELKKSLWLLCKVWGPSVNPLTADDKYSLLNRGNLLQHFQMHLSQKRKMFCKFFFTFCKFIVNFEHIEKKMTLIADTSLNLRTLKYIVREMSKKFRLRGAFDKWDGKQDQTLLKSERQHPYHIYWSLWRKLELKKSLWAICSVWGLFVNPLRAHDKYSLLNSGYLLQHFQMHLSERRKRFCEFFLDIF